MQHQTRSAFILLSALCVTIACRNNAGTAGDTSAVGAAASSTSPEQNATSHLLVAGDSLRFIEHPENLPAGFPMAVKALPIKNLYEGSGAMGPTFQDGRWHFGGSAGEVFESIYQGRPDGMPAWGGRITNDQIWMLTAYVRSLSSKDLSTENFTGKTVERTGH